MSEIKNILKDVQNNKLPVQEIPGFLWFIMPKSVLLVLGIVVGVLLAYMLR